jgi:hypothetical protein
MPEPYAPRLLFQTFAVTVSEESKMLDRFKPLLTHVKYVYKKILLPPGLGN